MPLDKNGEPYSPLSERELKRIRQRPYPTEVTRLRALLDQRAAQLAREDQRRPEPEGVALPSLPTPQPRRRPAVRKRKRR